jgi:ubiquinone/menaquinone biosynthesis C-methylase UbiE
MSWARQRAVDVHDETAGYFSAEYSSDNVYDSPFRYGRALIDARWKKVVEQLPACADCLDIGSGIGAYMARVLEAGLKVRGIEPSDEMRKLSRERLPEGLVLNGSVTELPVEDGSQDFIYAIEVFRYLDAGDNVLGHREILRALKPGGVYFGTYVNMLALDGYRQFVALERLRDKLTKRVPRYHVEFETMSSLRRKLTEAGFVQVEIAGAMFAPLRLMHKVSPRLATSLSAYTLPRESWLSGGGVTRLFAGHLIALARRVT